MGNWKLEIFKMATYIFVPIGAYYVSQQGEFFEEAVRAYHKEHVSPKDKQICEMMDQMEKQRHEEQQKEFREQLKMRKLKEVPAALS